MSEWVAETYKTPECPECNEPMQCVGGGGGVSRHQDVYSTREHTRNFHCSNCNTFFTIVYETKIKKMIGQELPNENS